MGLILYLNRIVFVALNSLADRSWALDTLFAQLEANPLVKGAVVGACFFAAWFGGKNKRDIIQTRKLLLAGLVSTVIALAMSKSLSYSFFFPRPYVLSRQVYHLEEHRLVPYPRIPLRVPRDADSQALWDNYLDGNISVNPLGAVPSDHASFFLAVSLGILIANRRMGLIALLWTILAILPAKIVMGRHHPIDMVGGALVALFALFLVFYLGLRVKGRIFESTADWTIRHPMLSSALVFVVVFEIGSTLRHVYPLIDFVKVVGGHFLQLL